MTKKLVGLFASVALLSSGLALASVQTEEKGQQLPQSGQQMGGAGTQGQMGGAQQMAMGEKQVTGTVVKRSADELKLRTDNGIIAVKVNKDTKFQDPTVKSAKDLKEGQQVRTSFDIKNDQNVAKTISLETGMGGGMGGGGMEQPSGSGGAGQTGGAGESGQQGGGSY